MCLFEKLSQKSSCTPKDYIIDVHYTTLSLMVSNLSNVSIYGYSSLGEHVC